LTNKKKGTRSSLTAHFH